MSVTLSIYGMGYGGYAYRFYHVQFDKFNQFDNIYQFDSIDQSLVDQFD